MKKILIIALFIAPFLTSCADLDLHPESSIDKNQFYQSENDALTAVNGIYAILTPPSGFYGMYNNQTVYLGDLASEYVKAGANTNSAHIREISNFTISSANDFMRTGWSEAYTGINRANIVIDKLSGGVDGISEEKKNQFVNEAKFLRALFYFNIVRWWGAVPLVLHDGEGEGQERTPVDDIYTQIVSDLKDASALSQTYHSEGRATGGAALATLSKVYLTWAQTDSPEGKTKQTQFYGEAVKYAQQVIDSHNYHLVPHFLDNFVIDKKNGIEHIFSVQHGNQNNVTGHCTFAGGWSDSEPVLIVNNIKFYDEFPNDDQRKEGSFAKSLYNPTKGERFTFKVPLFRKYIDTVGVTNQQGGYNTNNAYIRYAEVLLIKAEADNELNGPTTGAYDAINQVIRRAHRLPTNVASAFDISGLTKETFRVRLQEERWKEFVLEGHRWFDLVRWRKLLQTVNNTLPETDPKRVNIAAKHYLYPLPQRQLDLNPNLRQNWGYEGNAGENPYKNYEPGYTDK
jgi:hypothetical protein